MKYYRIIFLALYIYAPSFVYSDDSMANSEDEHEWIMVRPMAVSTTAIESANGVHCFIGIAYEANDARNVAVAMTRHCLDLVAIAALVRAEVADGDTEQIKLVMTTKATEYLNQLHHLFINGIDFDLSK